MFTLERRGVLRRKLRLKSVRGLDADDFRNGLSPRRAGRGRSFSAAPAVTRGAEAAKGRSIGKSVAMNLERLGPTRQEVLGPRRST
jgi:hypothetical protein